MFLQSSPLSSSVVRMEFGREVFHDGLEPLDASRLAQVKKSAARLLLFTISAGVHSWECLNERLPVLDVEHVREDWSWDW